MLLTQSFNLANLRLNGKLDKQTYADKKNQAKQEFERIKDGKR